MVIIIAAHKYTQKGGYWPESCVTGGEEAAGGAASGGAAVGRGAGACGTMQIGFMDYNGDE